jgi:hypothetical protein
MLAVRLGFCLALAAVVWGSLSPAGGTTMPGNDKMMHFLAYVVLGVLAMYGWPRRRALVVALLLAVGAAIEVLQGAPLIDRDTEMLDWLADAGGIAAAFAFVPLLRRVPSACDRASRG